MDDTRKYLSQVDLLMEYARFNLSSSGKAVLGVEVMQTRSQYRIQAGSQLDNAAFIPKTSSARLDLVEWIADHQTATHYCKFLTADAPRLLTLARGH